MTSNELDSEADDFYACYIRIWMICNSRKNKHLSTAGGCFKLAILSAADSSILWFEVWKTLRTGTKDSKLTCESLTSSSADIISADLRVNIVDLFDSDTTTK